MEVEKSGASAQSPLQLRLLGPQEITWAGEPLEVPRRQPRAILYRLAASPEAISRPHLCLLLWPDVPESEARRHLSNQIYNLRRALPDPQVILMRHGQLALDPGRFWSDVKAFERLSQSTASEDLQKAVDLYRGPFLEGFTLHEGREFSLWAEQEKRVLERRYLETLSALMANYAAAGNHDSAISCARRYLEIDDLAEDVHRRLIDLYAAQGDRRAALRQYEHCTAVLERELGVDPLPETRDVYLSVLEDRTIHARRPHPPLAWTTLPSLDAPLVGREEAINQLKAAFDRTQMGVGSAVLVSGEAGVGKSRLLQEFATGHSSEATVLAGTGYEAESATPYLPLVELLRPLLPTIDWISLGPDRQQLAQLLPLLPELRREIPDLPKQQKQEESAVIRGLAHLLICLARKHPPLILCLDDLHWTDESTRSWVGYLGRRLGEAPLLFLGGYRSEQSAVLEPLRGSLHRLNVLEEVRLRNLTEEGVMQLVRRLSGQTSGYARFCQRLHRLTGGNPFYTLETLRTLFESGWLQQDESGWLSDLDQLSLSFTELSWSKSVTDTVLRRVGRLRPATVQVLEAASVIGQRFELELVQAASGRSEREVIDALDELTARQLISFREDHYQFKHDLIRAIVNDNLSYGRRRLLHRRAGKALEERAPGNFATLARHFAEAGEREKAVGYSLQAGDQARQVFAHKEAVEFYQRALSIQEEKGDREAAARTLMRLGMTYQIAYDYPHARQAFDRSFSLRRSGQPLPQAGLSPAPRPLRLCLNSSPHPTLLFLGDHSELDPGRQKASHFFMRQLFSGLLRSGDDWTVQPEIARTWEISGDGLRYVFHLRDDAAWTDGEPVTASDFEFAWKRVLDPRTSGVAPEKIHLLYAIRGARAFHRGETNDPDSVAVRTVDPLTLEVDLEEPADYFLNLLTRHNTYPVPRHVVQRYGKAWTESGKLVTNGPFCLQEWQPGEQVTLARNPDYFGRFQGNLSQAIISNHWLSSAEQLEAYHSGQVDVLSLGRETYPACFQHPEEYHHVEAIQTYLLGFGLEDSPMHDRRVRQALGLAIDKEKIATPTLPGFDMPANGGFLPPSFPGHSPGIGLPYDPVQARKLLAEAGYPDGKGFPQLDLLTTEERRRYAQALQHIWDQQLGVQIELKAVGWDDFFKNLQHSSLFIVGWTSQYPDPYNFLLIGARYLAASWEHPGYNHLMQEAGRSKDQAERLRLYRQADRLLIEAAAIVPLFYRVDHYLVKPRVKINLQTYSLTDVILGPH